MIRRVGVLSTTTALPSWCLLGLFLGLLTLVVFGLFVFRCDNRARQTFHNNTSRACRYERCVTRTRNTRSARQSYICDSSARVSGSVIICFVQIHDTVRLKFLSLLGGSWPPRGATLKHDAVYPFDRIGQWLACGLGWPCICPADQKLMCVCMSKTLCLK